MSISTFECPNITVRFISTSFVSGLSFTLEATHYFSTLCISLFLFRSRHVASIVSSPRTSGGVLASCASTRTGSRLGKYGHLLANNILLRLKRLKGGHRCCFTGVIWRTSGPARLPDIFHRCSRNLNNHQARVRLSSHGSRAATPNLYLPQTNSTHNRFSRF